MCSHPTPIPPLARSLSGSTHHVHTGVVLVVPQLGPAASVAPGPADSIDEGWLVRSFACSTEVEFEELDNDTIDAYIKSGGPPVCVWFAAARARVSNNSTLV